MGAADPTFFKATVNLALMHDELKNYAKAIEVFETAAALQPENAEVWSHMGNTYYAQRQYPKAMELYRKALSLQAEATDEFYNLGTGVQTSIKQLCDLILDLKGSQREVTYKPYAPEDARRLVQNRIGCPEKAKHDLGFVYQDKLRDGLLDLIAWRDSHQGEY